MLISDDLIQKRPSLPTACLGQDSAKHLTASCKLSLLSDPLRFDQRSPGRPSAFNSMESLAGKYASSSSSSASASSSSASSDAGGCAPSAAADDDDFKIVSIKPAASSAPFPAPAVFDAAIGPSRPPSTSGASQDADAEDPTEDSKGREPSATEPSAALSEWVKSTLELRETRGLRLEEKLRENATFRNPAFCAKMISVCGLDEHGTFLEGRGDHYGKDGGFYDVLADRQRREAEERAARGSSSKMLEQHQQINKRKREPL